MFICPNCQNTSIEPSNFCPKCGSKMIEKPAEAATYTAPAMPEASAYTAPSMPEAPAFSAPTFEPAAYTTPQPTSIPYQPEKKVPLGKVIAGMAIAIVGFVLSMLTLLYTFLFLSMEREIAVFFAVYLGGFFAFPLSLVGFILSKSSANAGSKYAMTKVGKILGLIGWIVPIAAIVISIIGSM